MGMPMGLETAPQVLRGAVPGLFFSASGWNSGTIFQRRNAIMPFQLRPYFPPVFSTPALENAPDAVFHPAPRDGVAPENFHAMSIFPEYFKIAGQWHLARESRMDCVAVWDRGRIDVREFRRLRWPSAAQNRERRGSSSTRTASGSAGLPEMCLPSGRAAPGRPPFPGTMTSSMNCCATNGTTAR